MKQHKHTASLQQSPTWRSWQAMRRRCYGVNTLYYKNYGGRGIKVSDAWKDFSVFLTDMGERPKDMSIDRINVNGDYTPDNCRWATKTQQQRNRRTPKSNTSGYVGVFWSNTYKKWVAQIKVRGKLKRIGIYTDLLEAATARKLAEYKYWNNKEI